MKNAIFSTAGSVKKILIILFLSITLSGYAQLQGTYTIGKGGDFETFSDAANALHKDGVFGPVTFNVLAGTYNEQFILGKISGISRFAPVVFQSESGNYKSAVLSFTPPSEAENYIVKIDGTENLVFRHLSFEMTGLGTSFDLGGGASNISIDSCHFSGVYNTNSYEKYALICSNDPQLSNIFIKNNYMENCGLGVFLQGWNNDFIEEIEISDNTFQNVGYAALSLNWCSAYEIKSNTIGSNNFGIYAPSTFGLAEVSENRITANSHGITLKHIGSFTEKCLIANNFVLVPGLTESQGIDIRNSSYTNVLFNSVLLYSTWSESKAFSCSGSATTNTVNIMNNIFACMNDGYACYVSSTQCIANSDNNNLYTPGNWLARWESDVFDLYDLRMLSGKDQHSLSVYPYFMAENDLHCRSLHLNGRANPLMEVANDIDGQPRDGVNPDIGADEYSILGLGAMHGKYTVGATGDYQTLSEAVSDLRWRGVMGNVFLEMIDALFEEQVVINSIPGTGPQSRVTIARPVFSPPGDSVVIRFASTQADSNYVIRLLGADHITISGLHIEATGDTYARAVVLDGGCDSIRILNNTISGLPNQNNDERKCLIYSEAGYFIDRHIEGNLLRGGTIGMFFTGISLYRPFTPGLQILDNVLTNVGYSGIQLQYHNAPVITGNIIRAGYRGIQMSGCAGPFRIEKNQMDTKGQYGIRLTGSEAGVYAPASISNNFIHVGGTGDAIGIYVSSTDYTHIVYNSVNITSTDLSDGRAFQCSSGTGLYLRNNIFSNQGGGYSSYISSPSSIFSSDYNDLYTSGANLAYYQGNKADLAVLRSASGDETNSISVDPAFTSDADLHTASMELMAAGTPVSGIMDDIDNEDRHLETPDIGADEFSGGGGDPLFSESPVEMEGFSAGQAIWCDFDRDSDLDILSVGSGKEGMYRNNGDGSFTAVAFDIPGETNNKLLVTDYNLDGDPDLLILGGNFISVWKTMFYNLSTGELTNVDLVDNAGYIYDMDCMDADNDGDPDFILVGRSTENHALFSLCRNEDGVFTEEELDTDMDYITSVAVSDYDSDGDFDLAISGSVAYDIKTDIYRNVNGNFYKHSGVSLPGVTDGAIEWGDYDADGDPDLLIFGKKTGLGINKLFRNEDGIFTEVPVDLPPLLSACARWVDYDADGDLDLAICGEEGSTFVTRLYENQNGNFEALPIRFPGVANGSVAWGDYDNDGDPDLLLSGNLSGDQICKIFINNTPEQGSGPAPPSNLTAEFSDQEAILSWDPGSDAETTQAALNYHMYIVKNNEDFIMPALLNWSGGKICPDQGSMHQNTRFRITGLEPGQDYKYGVMTIDQGFRTSEVVSAEFTTPEGIFSEEQKVAKSAYNSDLEFFDMDNDGDPDLLQCGALNYFGYVYRNDDGYFERTSAYIHGMSYCDIDCGDIDNDGYVDLAVTGRSAYGDYSTMIYKNSGGDRLNYKQQLIGGHHGFVDFGDMDNDGDLDLIVSGYTNRDDVIYFELFENNGEGFFTPTGFLENVRPSKEGAVLKKLKNSDGCWGDYDNDGDLDLLVTGHDGDAYTTVIIENLGAGAFRMTDFEFTVNANAKVAWADFNNDGRLDLVIAGQCGIEVYKNLYNMDFQLFNDPIPSIYLCEDLSCGDYNNDGYTDILVHTYSKVEIYQNTRGGEEFISLSQNFPSIRYGAAKWADIDGDGTLDFAITGYGIDSTTIYTNYSMNKNTPPHRSSIRIAGFQDMKLGFSMTSSFDEQSNSQIPDRNIRIGTAPGMYDIKSPMSLSEGTRCIPEPGNIGLAGHWELDLQQINSLGSDADLYCSVQAVDPGFMASAFSTEKKVELSGEIVDVSDVPYDQGGKVFITWSASDLDTDVKSLTFYSIWRAVSGSQKKGLQEADIKNFAMSNDQPAFRKANTSDPDLYWEWVANQPAQNMPHYAFTCETLNDSMPESLNEHYFMITAHTARPDLFFDSKTVSGYSVDNLSPYAPVNLQAETQSGAVHLSWTGNAERDLGFYLVFRGIDPGFDPSTMMPYAEIRDIYFTDTGMEENTVYYYVVCARDIHGNVSAPSNEVSSMITGLERFRSTIPESFALDEVYPNPCRDEAVIGFRVPVASDISLEIYDAAGRKIIHLLHASLDAGRYTYTWRIEKTLPSGVYTCLLRSSAAQKVTRLVIAH